MTLSDIKTALETVTGFPFAEYAWQSRPLPPYGTLQLDGQGASLWSGNKMREQAVQGSVDVFVRGGSEAAKSSVQSALASLDGLSWRLYSVQYESDTKLTHLEWVFEYAEAQNHG